MTENKILNERLQKEYDKYLQEHNVPANMLKKIPWPKCSRNCYSLATLGVCECEVICSFKFKEEEVK